MHTQWLIAIEDRRDSYIKGAGCWIRPEFSTGTYRVLETSEPTKIFAHSCQDENGNAVIAAHNLTEAPIKVVIKLWEKTFDHFIHLFDERPNEKIKNAGIGLELSGFGFSWLRLRQKKQI